MVLIYGLFVLKYYIVCWSNILKKMVYYYYLNKYLRKIVCKRNIMEEKFKIM